MVYIEAVRMSTAGTGHEHIAGVRWRNPGDQNTGDSTTAVMVKWIDDGGVAKVASDAGDVSVGTVEGTPKYLRTHADGKWTNNLLSLPRY